LGPRSPSPLIASVGEPESRKTKREGRVEAIVVVSADGGGGRSQIRRQQLKTFSFTGKNTVGGESTIQYSMAFRGGERVYCVLKLYKQWRIMYIS
jgi:hypothetical protein